MRYLPLAESDLAEMLRRWASAVSRTGQVLPDICVERDLDLPPSFGDGAFRSSVPERRGRPMVSFSEPALMITLSLRRRPRSAAVEFYGLHPLPARSEPGTLQAVFEFQTLICQLTGMDSQRIGL
jgi:hypothetical protein